MTLRTATVDDREAIREVAEQSFQASYSLSPEQIETIVEEEFAGEPLAARIEDPESLVVVGEADGAVAAFAEVDLETGRLRWLHVDPVERGKGLGTALIERVTEELSSREKPLTAYILDEAIEGNSFLERFGLNRTDTTSTVFGDQELAAHVYTKSAEESDPNEPDVTVPETVTIDGTEHPVDQEEPIPGTEAPFFLTYTDAGRGERAGFFCSSCGSTDVSVDGMDRIECGNCGNKHRADEWDDAYL